MFRRSQITKVYRMRGVLGLSLHPGLCDRNNWGAIPTSQRKWVSQPNARKQGKKKTGTKNHKLNRKVRKTK